MAQFTKKHVLLFLLVACIVLFNMSLYQDRSRSKYLIGDFLNKDSEENTSALLTREQQYRQLRVQKACTFKRFLKQNENLRYVHLTYSTRARISYCILPKVACTNWKKLFLAFYGMRTQEELWKMTKKNWVHTLPFKRIYAIKSDSEREYVRNNFYSFMFSRHPFQRLVASYRNKIAYPISNVYQVRYGSQMLNMSRKDMEPEDIAKGRGVTFPEFVKYLIATNPWKYDEHWAIQFRFCQPCIAGFSYYGKMETLLEDAEQILKNAGLDKQYSFLYNMTDDYEIKTSELTFKYFKEVSKSDILKLYKIYEEDFDAFGYTMDDYLDF